MKNMRGTSLIKSPSFCLIMLCIFTGALALLVQYIPLYQIPLLSEYVEAALLLTTSGDVSAGSSFPDSAKVYFSFAWLMFPLFFILLWKWGQKSDGKYDTLLFKPEEKLTIGNRLVLLLLTPLWAGLFIGEWFAFDGGDARLFKLGSSLPVLICFGWIAPGSLAVAAFTFLASLKKAFTGKI